MQNVLIISHPPDDWAVKLSDFGLTKRSLKGGDSTTVKGTYSFLPPELLGYENRKCDPFAGDMWSAGESSYFLLTSKSAFPELAVRAQFVNDSTVFPTYELEVVDAGTDATNFVRSLLAAQPTARPSAVQALSHSWLMIQDEYHPPVPSIMSEWPQMQKLDDALEASVAWSTGPTVEPKKTLQPKDAIPLGSTVGSGKAARPKKYTESKSSPRSDEDAQLEKTPQPEGTLQSEDSIHPGTVPTRNPDDLDSSTDKGYRNTKNVTDQFIRSQPEGGLKSSKTAPATDDESQMNRYPVASSHFFNTLPERPRPGAQAIDAGMRQTKPIRLNQIEMRMRPKHISKTQWVDVVNIVHRNLGGGRIGPGLPSLKSVATLLRVGPKKATADLSPGSAELKDLTLADEFLKLYTDCDVKVLSSPWKGLRSRGCACLMTLAILLQRQGTDLGVREQRDWDAWADPKTFKVSSWKFAAEGNDLVQCGHRCQTSDCFGNGQADWQCFSCLKYFCILHREESKHSCQFRTYFSARHYHEILKMLFEDYDDSHLGTVLQAVDFKIQTPKSQGNTDEMDKRCIMVIVENRNLDSTTPFDPIVCRLSPHDAIAIGTDETACSLSILFDTPIAKNKRAIIKRIDDEWVIRDASTGGAAANYLNGTRLSRKHFQSRWRTLRHGDCVQIGTDGPRLGGGASYRAIKLNIEFFQTEKGAASKEKK